MFKTGNVFIDSFSKGIMLLPLLPVCIIFLRKIYLRESLNFLMILCLLNFGENLGLLIPGLKQDGLYIIKNIFSLLELVVFTRIFGADLAGRLKDGMNIFLVSLLSVFITYHVLEGTSHRSVGLDAAQNGIVVLLAIPGICLLARSQHIFIFNSPLFWITTGTLFYFLIVILMELIGECCRELPNAIGAEKMMFINIASLVRFLFYALAGLFYQPDREKDDVTAF